MIWRGSEKDYDGREGGERERERVRGREGEDGKRGERGRRGGGGEDDPSEFKTGGFLLSPSTAARTRYV